MFPCRPHVNDSLVTLDAGGSSQTISVTQTMSPIFTPFAIQHLQAVLYSYPGCVKLTNNSTGSFTGLSDGTYVVVIKYDPGTVVGQTKPSGSPPGSGAVVHTFTTNVNGIPGITYVTDEVNDTELVPDTSHEEIPLAGAAP